jgi:TetR/AcrR family transcriptional regulator, transcriptional repressor of bet genes
MPRPQNTEQRKREIVQGLAEVMAERGYAKATVQAIARAAGMTPGLVHYHFRSKQEILIALIEGLAEVVRARLRAGASDPEDRLGAAIDAFVGTEAGVDAQAVACWVVVGAEAVREPVVRDLYESVMRTALSEFTAIFREAMRKAGGSGAGAPAAALAVVAAIEGFFRLAAGAPSCVPPGAAARSIRAVADAFLAGARVVDA